MTDEQLEWIAVNHEKVFVVRQGNKLLIATTAWEYDLDAPDPGSEQREAIKLLTALLDDGRRKGCELPSVPLKVVGLKAQHIDPDN